MKEYQFIEDIKGIHKIGGEIPADFNIPKNDFLGVLQYVGLVSCTDKIIEWLTFDVNLIAPIYLDFEKVYMNYENPNSPTIISPKNASEIGSAYDDLKTDSEIIFNEVKLSIQEFEGRNEDNYFDIIAVTGKPDWEQNSEIPICPKSNQKMKFLCQLMTFGEIETKRTNIKCEDEGMQEYFNNLNFWCDGSLFVFVEPNSKTVCYFIQNT
jgi:hypothetical protein